MKLRPWTESDAAPVAGLLTPDSDPLWAAQGHLLHGPARDGERWRRTLVAHEANRVVGAGTVAANPVHGGRYSCAIEVAHDQRRRGIARTLLTALRELRPEPLPLAGKIREADPVAWPFGQAMGARVYQRCRCPRLDLTSSELATWRRETPATDAELSSMSRLSREQAAALFEEQYRWVHQEWSPVTSPQWLRQISAATVAEADLEASSCAWRDGRVVAAVFAFAEPDGSVSLVAETQRRTEAGGGLLSAALARSLTALTERGFRIVEFDGHDDDPHLAPLVARLPVASTSPLLLVELR
jgi:GNAT superfamily N-acetyltransferase